MWHIFNHTTKSYIYEHWKYKREKTAHVGNAGGRLTGSVLHQHMHKLANWSMVYKDTQFTDTDLSSTGTSMSWSPIRTFNRILSGFGFGDVFSGITVVDVTLWTLDSDAVFAICLTAVGTTVPQLLNLACFLFGCLACCCFENGSPPTIIVLSGNAASAFMTSSAKKRPSAFRAEVPGSDRESFGTRALPGCCARVRFVSDQVSTFRKSLSTFGHFRFCPRASSTNQSSPMCSDSVTRAGSFRGEVVDTVSGTCSHLLDEPPSPTISEHRQSLTELRINLRLVGMKWHFQHN